MLTPQAAYVVINARKLYKMHKAGYLKAAKLVSSQLERIVVPISHWLASQ
ncbi:hypothetical protein [Candidatus Vallotia tarda]|nr:hypothetical protein [Candidatus Vallotia tarda]